MKFIKSLLLGILGLLAIISLFIIICAFNPELSDKISDLIYRQGSVKSSADIDIPSLAQATDTSIPATRENNQPATDSNYIPPEKATVSVPDEVAGKNGYIPVTEENEQVNDEEAEKLKEKYTYGETGDNLTFDTEYYPYYGMLDENQQKLYRQIYANAMIVNGAFYPVVQVSPSQLRDVFLAVFNDHPELFWLDSAYRGRFDKHGTCVELVLQFHELIDDLNTAKNEFNAAAEEILAGARNLGSDYEKEVFVHNSLMDRITYELRAPFNQSAYSALVNDRTVCAGYARALQHLMIQLGIPCYYCTGYAGQNHAWNIIQLDGEYYNVDTTWDDSEPNTYDYFNKSDAEFSSTHVREDLSVYLPACNGQAYSNLENNPSDTSGEYYDDYRMTLAETGFSEERVLKDLEAYYDDCYNQIMGMNGSCEFQNVVDNENIWLACYDSYRNDGFADAYMNQVLSELDILNCEINVEAEELADGRFLLRHYVTFF